MNIAYRTPLTVPEYLAWADAQSERPRTELIDGQIVETTPALLIHARLKVRAFKALDEAMTASRLAGEVLPDGVLLQINASSAYVPDVQVYLGEIAPGHQRLAPEPLIVVEVLSPSTAHIDRGLKLAGYFSLPGLQHYVIIDPETMSVTHHQRRAAGSIASDTLTGGTLTLDPPGLALDLDRILTR